MKIYKKILFVTMMISCIIVKAQTNINNYHDFKFLEIHNNKIIKNVNKMESKNIEIDLSKNIKSGEAKNIEIQKSTNEKLILNNKKIQTTNELEEWKHIIELEICWEEILEIKLPLITIIDYEVPEYKEATPP